MGLLIMKQDLKGKVTRDTKEEKRMTKNDPSKRQVGQFIRRESERNEKKGVNAFGEKLTPKQHESYYGKKRTTSDGYMPRAYSINGRETTKGKFELHEHQKTIADKNRAKRDGDPYSTKLTKEVKKLGKGSTIIAGK